MSPVPQHTVRCCQQDLKVAHTALGTHNVKLSDSIAESLLIHLHGLWPIWAHGSATNNLQLVGQPLQERAPPVGSPQVVSNHVQGPLALLDLQGYAQMPSRSGCTVMFFISKLRNTRENLREMVTHQIVMVSCMFNRSASFRKSSAISLLNSELLN